MYLSKVLNAMRSQRHEYVNHLQIILGYIQLGKTEDAVDYIYKVSNELRKLKEINLISDPEIRVVLISSFYDAAERNIKIVYNIHSDLGKGIIAASMSARIIAEVIDNILVLIDNGKHDSENSLVVIDIKNEEYDNIISFYVPNPSEQMVDKCREWVLKNQKKYAGYGANLLLSPGYRLKIIIIYPMAQP